MVFLTRVEDVGCNKHSLYLSTGNNIFFLQFILSASTVQVKTRIENEQYLRSHPEITLLLSSFLR